MKQFDVKDCALLLRMSGLPPAMNLRELRERVAAADESVLYHHFFETPLRPSFDDPFYRNDFAVWASTGLRDQALAERLGIVDPYGFDSVEAVRATVLEIFDDRLGEVPSIPWAAPGHEFFFMEALTVVFDTGVRIAEPSQLASAIRRMTTGSVYYHFLEARRREPRGRDDFSAWLGEEAEAHQPHLQAIGSVDFYFRSLPRLRDTLADALDAVGGGV